VVDFAKLDPAALGRKHWEDSLSQENSIINEIFCGQFRNTLTCSNCNNTSVNFELFSDISLAFPPPRKNFTPDLRDFISHFLKEELIPSFNCPKCKKPAVRKSFTFNKAPPVLVFHLKRFSSRREKINDGLTFPLELNLGSLLPQNKGTKIIFLPLKYMIFFMPKISSTNYPE
jgi:ubiquitin C-terminal hydrolase